MKNRTIQARIEDKAYEELEFLKKDLGMKETTQVISFALHHLFTERKKTRENKSPFEAMEELGLIGSFSGAPDLSENYKEVLINSLKKKHRPRRGSDEK